MKLIEMLPDTFVRRARAYGRKLWVRVVIMGVMAPLALALTQVGEYFIPDELAKSVDGESADRLLAIIANALLAVTTFSLTAMVTVHRAVSSEFTPRVHRLILRDRTTQNTMAVFIGAYVYALMGIILRETGVFQDDGAFILFYMTVLVLVIIVVYLIRWVLHLQTFGSLVDTARQVEDVTREQLQERLATPCLGAHPLTGEPPKDAWVLRAHKSGYVQHIYPEALNHVAELHDINLYLGTSIGRLVFLNEPLMYVTGPGAPEGDGPQVDDPRNQDSKEEGHFWQSDTRDLESDDLEEALRAGLTIGDMRTSDQDPNLGLTMLSEMASKALSPGINDPGTAIAVTTRIGRVLSFYRDETEDSDPPKMSRLHVRPLEPEAMIRDGLAAMARDGAMLVEVQEHLQVTLSGLMQHPDAGLAAAARLAAVEYLTRALGMLDFEPDRARLLKAANPDVVKAASAG